MYSLRDNVFPRLFLKFILGFSALKTSKIPSPRVTKLFHVKSTGAKPSTCIRTRFGVACGLAVTNECIVCSYTLIDVIFLNIFL